MLKRVCLVGPIMIDSYLDTRQLEAFVAVISIGSMTGAAKALGKSQPVISRLIQDLEKDIGFTLLHRNGPRISPTAQGIAFFSKVELLLGGLRTISQSCRHIETAAGRAMEITAVPELAASLAPLALARLPEPLFPNEVHIRSTSCENVIAAVLARTADIGLVTLPVDHAGLETHWIGEVSHVAVLRHDDPLVHAGLLTSQHLAGRSVIAPPRPHPLRVELEQAMGAESVEIGGILNSNSAHTSIAMARAGLGIAIVESTSIRALPIKDIAVLPLSFHIPFRWAVVTAPGHPLRTNVLQLIDALEQAAFALPDFRKLDASTQHRPEKSEPAFEEA